MSLPNVDWNQILNNALGKLSISEKYNLFRQFHILSKVLEFDIRSAQLHCQVTPFYHSEEGWHLSTCVYPNKIICNCKYYLSDPTNYFARDNVQVSKVLNNGFHWENCPISHIASRELMVLNACKQVACECLIDTIPTIKNKTHSNKKGKELSEISNILLLLLSLTSLSKSLKLVSN